MDSVFRTVSYLYYIRTVTTRIMLYPALIVSLCVCSGGGNN